MHFLRSGGALSGRSKLTRLGHHQPEDLEIVCLTESVLCFLMAGESLTPIALGIRKRAALLLQLCQTLERYANPPGRWSSCLTRARRGRGAAARP